MKKTGALLLQRSGLPVMDLFRFPHAKHGNQNARINSTDKAREFRRKTRAIELTLSS